ncbi:hypothetical protein BpHYR1_032349 [Brachionus plicatilis]|uniref:Uncharacterized protein n=1 Tax=Brachionus plicatilis TaxID=10195 RepID=A0A3M7QR92_BRAPC|nr:hypothetical protein BpHYR1_032349 [Brachionus plicatilis]
MHVDIRSTKRRFLNKEYIFELCLLLYKRAMKNKSILDYSFPCLNSFSETNIKKIQVIQYPTPLCNCYLKEH